MLNRVILIGRLTRDPELRYTPNGVATCSFTLAVERQFKQNGKKEADFLPVVTWKQTAEACANYLGKGRLCALEGRIQTRNYEKDGRKVYITEVIADNVRFLESKNQSEAEETGSRRTEPNGDDDLPIDISDSDLPF